MPTAQKLLNTLPLTELYKMDEVKLCKNDILRLQAKADQLEIEINDGRKIDIEELVNWLLDNFLDEATKEFFE